MKLDAKISEADFKDMVISVAKRYGWLCITICRHRTVEDAG
jgi:hypothetical protein